MKKTYKVWLHIETMVDGEPQEPEEGLPVNVPCEFATMEGAMNCVDDLLTCWDTECQKEEKKGATK